MKKIILLIFAVLTQLNANAQFIKETSLSVAVGYGLSAPYDDVNVVNTGFYLQGEYVLSLSNWIDLRPYAGLILTKSDGKDLDNRPTAFKASTNAFLLGGKTRLTAPIPWVAPYLEFGIGTSIGSFRTFTPNTDTTKSGVILHIPFSLGLQLGRNHNVDIAFSYYFQPSVSQFAGAAALGISFPMPTK